MKLIARLRRSQQLVEHELELAQTDTGDGLRRFVLDGKIVEAHCAQISPGLYSLLLDGRSYEAHLSKQPGDAPGISTPYVVVVGLRRYVIELRDPRQWRRTGSAKDAEGPQEIIAPMPGKIVGVLVKEDQQVSRDQSLLVIEAMKMQNELRAPRQGRVARIYTTEGQGVEAGARLLRLE